MQFPYNNRCQNVERFAKSNLSRNLTSIAQLLIIYTNPAMSCFDRFAWSNLLRKSRPQAYLATLRGIINVHFSRQKRYPQHAREIVGGYEIYSRHRLARSSLILRSIFLRTRCYPHRKRIASVLHRRYSLNGYYAAMQLRLPIFQSLFIRRKTRRGEQRERRSGNEERF